MKPHLAFALVVALLVAGCNRNGDAPALPEAERPAKADVAPIEDVRAVAAGNNAFALDLARQIRDDNLFFSPLSVSTALSMTYAGARGDTAAQMHKALHYPFDGERLHLGYAGLLGKMTGAGKPAGVQLSVANALWGKAECKPQFLTINRDCYAAHVKHLDLVGAEPVINKWAEDNTAGRIKDLLAPGTLNGQHLLVLTNAVYFKGDWAHQFAEKDTTEKRFFMADNKTAQVKMMSQKQKLRLGEFDRNGPGAAKVLTLPYKGGHLSMVVVLPEALDGLAKTEEALTAAKLDAVLEASEERRVQVSLPRFKIAGATTELNKPLIALGMSDAFSVSKADFKNTFVNADAFIDKVLHKAFVEVNEEGSEAAAATAVLKKEEGKEHATAFNADHPFLFLIRDNRTGCILFLGRLTKPA